MSPHICLSCRRLNPPSAAYCYFDGTPLATGVQGPRAFGSEEFPTPFVLPCGLHCRSFQELAHACRQNWGEARHLLKEGGYRGFLVALGRADLVQAAERAAKHPNLDLGLDDFLARLPGCQPAAPQLRLGTEEIDLGTAATGQDRNFPLTIENTGERLLSGLVRSVDCLWLGVATPHLNEKHFQATAGERVQIPLHVRGKQLRAGPQMQVGEVAIESNAGVRSIPVRIRVPVTAFPDGLLKGAETPRQLAEKARANPQETARLLENGAVARWYQCNGWTYPITRPAATGLALVQQYFEALGLTMPTRVELRTGAVTLRGAPGGKAQGRVVLAALEKRPIYAHAQADQPWLTVGATEYKGQEAVIPLSVAAVPACSGQTLRAELSVQANGEQRFKVPVSLLVGPSTATDLKHRGHTGFELPPLPDAGLPPLPDTGLPPLPDRATGASDAESIPLAEARFDSTATRSRWWLSCACLLLSFVLLTSSAALAAWKLLNAVLENAPAPPAKPPAAVAPREGHRLPG